MDNAFKQLGYTLDNLTTEKDKISAITSFLRSDAEKTRPIDLISFGQTQDPNREDLRRLVSLCNSHGISPKKLKPELLRAVHDRAAARGRPKTHLDHLECGNHDINRNHQCNNKAMRVCSRCRLVGYCSEQCQKENWKIHKQDCKHGLIAKDWRPHWVQEGVAATYKADKGAARGWEDGSDFGNLGSPRNLWGTMPALNVLNLEGNEGRDEAMEQDFSLAFVASEDLRNLLRTINDLPDDYRGYLTILLNDTSPMVVCRNLIILYLLGLVPDLDDATEYAIHLWYSVFLPDETWMDKHLKLFRDLDITSNTKATHRKLSFGPQSSLNVLLDDETLSTLFSVRASNGSSRLSPGTATQALHNLMMAPQRIDYRHRYYYPLEPSHRVAFHRWRETGIVYPFAACNARLNIPNPWLFDPEKHLLLLFDSAIPYRGWDLKAMFAAGDAHGTTREDIFGCLYFFLKDELRKFAHRLRTFKINISLARCDAIDLAGRVGNGSVPGIPQSISFDRIHVSNIVDTRHVGVKRVLELWGPLLKSKKLNRHAALIGLFTLTWALLTPGAISDEKDSTMHNMVLTFATYYPETRVPGLTDHAAMAAIVDSIEIVHENSESFERYLRDQGAFEASESVGLEARKANKIVSHRIGVPLGSPHSALPPKLSTEDKYALMSLYTFSWQDRYVEWQRV